MRIRMLLTLVSSIALAVAFAGATAAAEPLKCGVHDFMPISGYADSQPVGVSSNVAQEAFKRAGIAVQIEARPFARLLQELKEGTLDCGYVVAHNSERAEFLRFVEVNLVTNEYVIYMQKGKAIPFSTPTDLKGLKVGITRGYYYGPDFETAVKSGIFTTEETSTNEVNFQKLAAGRIDALTINSLAGKSAIKAFPPDTFVLLPTPVRQHPTYLAFSKKADLEPAAKQFEAALKQMLADGSWARIVEKYTE